MNEPKPRSCTHNRNRKGCVCVWGGVRGHSASQPSTRDNIKHFWNVLYRGHLPLPSFLQSHVMSTVIICILQMEIRTQVLTHLASIALQPRWGSSPLPAPA